MPVYRLADAYHSYWNAKTFRENQAAYHEILLFGGDDGWAYIPTWRNGVARWLRRLALKIERR